MRGFHFSLSGLSIVCALGLAAWEWYFFYFTSAPTLIPGLRALPVFTPSRLGFNLAWLVGGYLTIQLLSIPFALPTAKGRFIGVVDNMASLVPLVVPLVVLFGKPHLLNTPERWETALLLVGVTAVDVFGGYLLTIALSRRVVDVAPGG